MRRARALAAAGLLIAAGSSQGALQDDKPPPYIGTPPRVVERMLSLAKVRSTDLVMDLGSGDGRIVLEAARRFGARAVGIEMNASLVSACQEAARKQGLAERATCRQDDVFATDLRAVTVLTLYLSPEFNAQLAPRILEQMRPGTRVVSHDFAVGAWPPDAVEQMHVPEKNFGRGGESTVMLFIVPARAAGRWRGSVGEGAARRDIELSIVQQYQRLEGALHRARGYQLFTSATLVADQISVEWPDPASPKQMATITARIEGDRMHGAYRLAGGAELPFTAQRTSERPDIF
jgi:hypothetical protein